MATKKSRTLNMERAALFSQGVAAVLFGAAAVFWPGLTTAILVYLFAGFLLVDAVASFIWGMTRPGNLARGLLIVLLALLQLAVGLYLARNPEVAFATLILVLGLALIVRGVFAFGHVFAGNHLATGKTMYAILGFLGVLIGAIVLAQPVASGLAFVWLLGLYALLSGPIMIAMSIDLGRLR